MTPTDMQRLSDLEMVQQLASLQRELTDTQAELRDLRADLALLRQRVGDLEGPERPAGSCVHWVPPGTYCHQCGERVER